MSKAKFKFNDKTLQYEKVEISWKDRLKKMGVQFGFSILLSLAFIILSYPIVEQIIARKQIVENSKLKREYNFLSTKMDELEYELNILRVRDDSVYTNIFGTAPVSKSLRSSKVLDNDEYKHLKSYSNSKIMLETAEKLHHLEQKVQIHKKSFERIEKLTSRRHAKLAHVPAIQPIPNTNLIRTGSGYGMRLHPVYNVMKMHTGIDFTAKIGTEIFATGDGIVTTAIKSRTGYGNHVVIKHGFGYQTLYAHLNRIDVRVGQKIKRGNTIGSVGNTGTSTAPHLHYEVIQNGKKVDPINFFFNDLTYDEYKEIIKISQSAINSMD